MRIAYLTQSYPPMISGAALVTQQVAEAMAQRGHKVLVIAASDRDHPYLVQSGNLTILRLGSIHNPMRVGQRFLLYPRRRVINALQEFHPDVIHTHEPLQMGFLGIEYARRTQIPITLTIHQLPSFVASYLPNFFRNRTESFLWLYARWLSRKFTSLITPTQTISHLVTRRTGFLTSTISYGLDLKTFHPSLSYDHELATRQKWNLPQGVPILLHVGRLDTDKRVDRVIDAAAQTLTESPAHLLMVGDGTQKSALIKLCNSLRISDRVHFLGYISRAEGLPEIYRIANLFVTTSEIETQGIVLLEAAASGLPLVAVRATCIPEIVHDGVNGYLVESGDIHGLGNAMSLLLSDPSKGVSMGKASRALAEKHMMGFSFDAHEQLYHQMIIKARTEPMNIGRHTLWERVKEWMIF